MFENLSGRLRQTMRSLRGQARLTESNIQDALREVRMALLEADVALPVVREFINQVKERAVGREVIESLNPGQVFVKVVHEELINIMGESNETLNLQTQPPAVILMAGLQGAGKTTSVGKLARYLKERERKKVAVVSADVYRPAAIEQLRKVAAQVDAEFIPSTGDEKPQEIARRALESAKLMNADVLIVDTAGRLHIDETLMTEIQEIHQVLNPIETLFVVDSMTGQDAANTAKAFNDALPLTGVVLTKIDGDARGGAALSIRHITQKPIKFLGVGEKLEALEPFHPDRLASRILDMGDVLSLVEEMEAKVDREEAERITKKFKKGEGLDLNDFKAQMEQMLNMGGINTLLTKLPGMGDIAEKAKGKVDDKIFVQKIAIINSMTPAERADHKLIKAPRRKRIADGAGVNIQEVHKLLKEFDQMQRMMKQFKGGGVRKMMRSLKGKLPRR
ncbi:signal recognition particle protein [Ignatzschineria cameli]|uniref:Signal recognition particle protein n=1 Tax=Ignatzschineria cameli TaxID=2182793 RepID=A0ABX5KYK4_9GAMM|nr:signal recognition particle protein [Ignatzschineria cameli]PWD83614.1 signal recognition particle protein [Ignatzschineria cameli]PWD89027.1 signal recognition particle protein [Ignatzschineria cameli]PWD90093.1 signal recognition particle protein [Ignatzschineria cameli]PWD90756.1 signal recognition particle protein [Ignatzschineria cameli]